MRPNVAQFIDLSGPEASMVPLHALPVSSTSVSDEEEEFNASLFLNLSAEAGYGPSAPRAATPPMRRQSQQPVIDLLDDEEQGFDLAALSPPAPRRPPAPSAPAARRVSPPRAVAAEPPAKRKARARKRDAGEKMADLKLECGDQLRDSRELREGLEMTQCPPDSLVARSVPGSDDCILFRVESRGDYLPHAVRVMRGSELVDALDFVSPDVVQCGPDNRLSQKIESLQRAHKERRLTLLVIDWNRAAGRCANIKDKRSVFDQVATLLQAAHGCNVTQCATMAEAGRALGRIAEAMASHLDDEATPNAFAFSLEGAAGGRGKKSSDRREVWTGMLVAIPGVSRTRAAAIVAAFPNLPALMERYRDPTLTAQQKKLLLSGLAIESNSARTMTLGPKVSERVFHVFTSLDGDMIIKETNPDKPKKAQKKKNKEK